MRGQDGGYSRTEKRTAWPGRADSWSELSEEMQGAGWLGLSQGSHRGWGSWSRQSFQGWSSVGVEWCLSREAPSAACCIPTVHTGEAIQSLNVYVCRRLCCWMASWDEALGKVKELVTYLTESPDSLSRQRRKSPGSRVPQISLPGPQGRLVSL